MGTQLPTDFPQQCSPARSASLTSEVFNTRAHLTPTRSQLGTQGAKVLAEMTLQAARAYSAPLDERIRSQDTEVDIYSFLSLNIFLTIYFRMASFGQTTTSGNHTSFIQNL